MLFGETCAPKWFSQRRLCLPSKFIDSLSDNLWIDAIFGRKYSQRITPTINGDNSRTTSISSLIFSCGPTTIPRIIVAVVGDSLKSRSQWSFAHVFKECKELHPSVAYRNSATAVATKVRTAFIDASLDHSLPTNISRCVRQAMLWSTFTSRDHL